MVVSNGFDRIRRPYSIIGEFVLHISVGIKYGVHGIVLLRITRAQWRAQYAA